MDTKLFLITLNIYPVKCVLILEADIASGHLQEEPLGAERQSFSPSVKGHLLIP